MRVRRIFMIAAIGAWLVSMASAQSPEAAAESASVDAAADTTKLKVDLEILQGATVEKDQQVDIVVTVVPNLPDVHRANVTVGLAIMDELNIENPDHVVVKNVYVDNGSGYSLQGHTAPLQRLGFQAPEGEVGLTAQQKVKWTVVFKENAAKAPLTATAALVIPPDPDIVSENGAQLVLKVKTALNVQQLWADGGIFMWPLGFALIIGVAFALERLWSLTFAKIDAQTFTRQLSESMGEGGDEGVKRAVALCNKTRGPVAGVIREGLLRVNQGIDHVEKAITSAGSVEGSFLQRGMVVLASVTTIAPLIGFLGTVWGMIIAFKDIAEAGDVKPSIVANGISQALITTCTGLIIAIVTQTFHNFLISRVNRIIIDMEETSTMLVDLLIDRGFDK